MNFLQALVARTLETADVVQPPRVPFVNAFPAPYSETNQAATEPASAAPPLQHEATPWRSRPAPWLPTAPPPRQHPAEAPAQRAAPMPPRPTRPPPPTVPPASPPEERIIERWISAEPGRVPASAAPFPPVEPAAPSAPFVEPPAREVRETHHHWVERRLEHIVERVDRPAVVPLPTPPPVEPRRSRQGVVAPPPPTPARDAAPPKVAPSVEGPALVPPRDVAPAIHVSIDLVVVKVQPPPVPARSETTRPVAPVVGLEAYTTARRRRPQ